MRSQLLRLQLALTCLPLNVRRPRPARIVRLPEPSLLLPSRRLSARSPWALETKAIAEQQAKIKAELAAAAKKAAEEKAALERAIKNRGYEPGVTDPKEIARQILKNKYGYGSGQFDCFNNIIMRESKWDMNATNPSSGAYGIPQALPGSKMATIASDWRTNPATQIIWGIKYMKDRYGSPCSAWGFKASHGWY